MCGIAGFLSTAPRAGLDTAALQRMLDAIRHRGPDGEGVWSKDGVHLGHRRLSIIDVAGGAQPMVGDTGCVITFNGEIYNYLELRDELERDGARFRTTSDTEVLLKLFERDGEKCLDRLIGMFAFVVWNPATRRLFLARDRLGKKPLYIFERDGVFAFASEVKALLELAPVRASAEPDLRAFSDVLSLGYVLTPKTIFKNVASLPAAHFAWVNGDGNLSTPTRYWDLAHFFTLPKLAAGPETTARFRSLFDDAVRLRLRSDVPLGGYLSGGMDSVSVLESMVRASETKVRAFCMGFDDPSYDESGYARLVAERLGCELEVNKQPLYSMPQLRALIWQCDQPFADTSIGPTYNLNQAARSHVKVALSGDGADEILAGYPTYRASAMHRVWRRAPFALRKPATMLAKRVLRPSYRKVGWDYKLRKFLDGHHFPLDRAHYSWRELFHGWEKERIFSDHARAELDGYDPFDTFADHFAELPEADYLDRLLYVDTKTWLQDDILVKVDRMSMAHSVEVRCPFLDHRLVEFCAQLPRQAKMGLLRQKTILRDATRQAIPAEVHRRTKKGFNAPTRHLDSTRLRNGQDAFPDIFRDGFELDPAAEDITFKSFTFAIIDAWGDMYDAYRKGDGWHA